MPRTRRKPHSAPGHKPSRKPSRKALGRSRHLLVPLAAGFLLAAAGTAGWVVWPFWQIAQQFGTATQVQPSRLYGRPATLAVGARVDVDQLVAGLERDRYRPADGDERLVPGRFRRDGETLAVARRRFVTADGAAGRDLLRITVRGGRVRGLEVDGKSVQRATLEPPLIASYYGSDLQERRPASIDELPEDLIYAVLAAEDAGFLDHPGISLSGVLRAAWVNFRAQDVRQGGSTLTQQLVKNRYLSHERTLVRKVQEAILALLIDRRYGKRTILGAYLDEIYWGRSGSVDLMGVGAAAWAYFGKQPADLDLAESALLAGMIRSPGSYVPAAHPERARARRDQILDRLAELRWIEAERLAAAKARPLDALEQPIVARQAPFFADAIAAEAADRFGIRELRDSGHVLLSTLEPEAQDAAEVAVREGVAAIEERWVKEADRERPLEAALISVDPRSGAILAYVGGRDYGRSQFDRVAQARRQAGSAFKPIVYAAAFEAGLSPASLFQDAPFSHADAGQVWRPANSDGRYRGWVTTRVALEQSLNVPTAKVGLRVGLNGIVDLAHRMGIESKIQPFPALTLGAMAVSPRELATAYATLANEGRRPWLHGLVAVRDRTGTPVAGTPLPSPAPALRPDAAYLVTHVLQGVLDVGTASSARRLGVADRLAGKTGTTNDRRDSWFAGYAPDRATLVWVGYDDNAVTRLSGTRAALPVWARFTAAVRPPGGYPQFAVPPGVVRVLIDPQTGALARHRCDRAVHELFLADAIPRTLCPLHYGRPLPQGSDLVLADDPEPERPGNPFKRWIERVKKKRRGGRP